MSLHRENYISQRAFYFYRMDLSTLRNRFARTQDIPFMAINKLSRRKLVNGMLSNEFGPEAVIEYVSQCIAWNKDKAFVEGTQ
jgi:hypothetical protein